jgi:hypothetical protein
MVRYEQEGNKIRTAFAERKIGFEEGSYLTLLNRF